MSTLLLIKLFHCSHRNLFVYEIKTHLRMSLISLLAHTVSRFILGFIKISRIAHVAPKTNQRHEPACKDLHDVIFFILLTQSFCRSYAVIQLISTPAKNRLDHNYIACKQALHSSFTAKTITFTLHNDKTSKEIFAFTFASPFSESIYNG